LTYPNGGEVLDPSKDHVITFKQSGLSRIEIRYTTGPSSDRYSGDSIDIINIDSSTMVVSYVLKANKLKCSSSANYKIIINGFNNYAYVLSDSSDASFQVYYPGRDNVSDVNLELIEPFDRYVYKLGEPFNVKFKYNHIDNFSISLVLKDGAYQTFGSSQNISVKVLDGSGIATADLSDIYVSDFNNQEYKIKLTGMTNMGKCYQTDRADINQFHDKDHFDYYGSEDTSEAVIFAVGRSSIRLKSYTSSFWDGRAVGHSFYQGGDLPIRWTQSGEIAKIGISIVPILFRSNPGDYQQIIVSDYLVPANGLPYAYAGSYDWQIPANFGDQLNDIRYEYTIVGYDSNGKELARTTSEVFNINKSLDKVQEEQDALPQSLSDYLQQTFPNPKTDTVTQILSPTLSSVSDNTFVATPNLVDSSVAPSVTAFPNADTHNVVDLLASAVDSSQTQIIPQIMGQTDLITVPIQPLIVKKQEIENNDIDGIVLNDVDPVIQESSNSTSSIAVIDTPKKIESPFKRFFRWIIGFWDRLH